MLFGKKKESRKKRVANAFKKGFGMDTHRAGCSLIRLPASVMRHRRESGEDPSELKSLDYEALLARWGIPREKVPRLKRTLVAEMVAYGLLVCLGVTSVVYGLHGPECGIFSIMLGLLIGSASLMHLLLRHHWYSILKNEEYRTFRDYLLMRRGK